MRSRHFVSLAWALPLLLVGAVVAEEKQAAKETITLCAAHKEFLSLEPILVTARLEGSSLSGLPAVVGKKTGASLQFEVEPAVKPRPGAKPLPLEARETKKPVQMRTYDLLEWLQFPAAGGKFTVRAVLRVDGKSSTSTPITVIINKPAKGDEEAGPVDRIHHTPWTNYDTNAFCGDTFDVVKRWPKSKMALPCHYWNGRFSQNKKEYDKAIASYRIVEKEETHPLADHAAYGIGECLVAQKKTDEARKHFLALQEKLKKRSGAGKAETVVGRLVEEALRPSVESAKK